MKWNGKPISLLTATAISSLSMVSCDRVTELAGEVTSTVTDMVSLKERRQGMRYIHPATEAELDQWLVEPNVLITLFFYDSTVPSNLMMKTRLSELAKTHEDVSAVLSFDIGKPGEVTDMALNRFNIQETPTLKLMLNSEELVSEIGPVQPKALEELYATQVASIDTSMELREGKLPGMDAKRPPEEMMVRQRKNELPSGIERVYIPEGAKDITEKVPKP
ncbi:thioredoxin family protein [Rubritalea marina]|uniref:thioredoxin family protein n=1 Tax=Rubritalea marina TaxID=361055 RepID=UPI0003625666|nr:thioredoxin family protein [Rubritalea marina]